MEKNKFFNVAMLKRVIVGFFILLLFLGMILVGQIGIWMADGGQVIEDYRYIDSFVIFIIIAIAVLEMRHALGEKIPKQFNVLIWVYALGFFAPYFWFGFTGVIFFTLAVFLVGCIIAVATNVAEGVLANFSFLIVYPAIVLSSLLYINKCATTKPIDNPELSRYLINAIRGEKLLPFNTIALAFVFIVSSMTDTFALIFGVAFGKHKLCPQISPKKTIEGAVGGVFGGLLGAEIVYVLFEVTGWLQPGLSLVLSPAMTIIAYILMGLIGAGLTQLGDLVASLIKRHNGIKDYSHILGAHGGIMDRFDGIMLNASFVAIVYLFIL